MISLTDVSFKYERGSELALSHLNLKVAKGDFLGIIGPTGAGKSTLAYTLSGVVPHHFGGDFYGECDVGGLDTVTASVTDISRMVGSVFQDIDGQMVSSMVDDEIRFALENFGFSPEETERRTVDALRRVGIEELRYRALSTLSGGQKQKVALCAVMAPGPGVLVLDEPTGELDPASSEQVFEILRAMNEAGTTIVVIEQKIMLLSRYASRLMVMDKGAIALEGKTSEVLEHVEEMKQMGINCPRSVELCHELRRAGLYSGSTPVTAEAAARMVREVLA